MMKHSTKFLHKISAWLLFCCLAILCVGIPVQSSAAMKKSAVKDKILQYCESDLGYTKYDLTFNNLVKTADGVWAFSLFVKNADESTNGLVIGKVASDGELIELNPPTAMSMFDQINTKIARSQRSYEALYALKQEWEPKLEQMTEEDRQDFDRLQKLNPIRDFIRHDIRLPDDTAISYEEAKTNAEKAINALPGWTPEMMRHIDIFLEVFHVPVGSDRPVYQFIYSVSSTVAHWKSATSNEPYTLDTDQMMQEEKEIFGKAMPYVISVRIDAQTGEQVGETYVEVPPVSGGSKIRFVLW